MSFRHWLQNLRSALVPHRGQRQRLQWGSHRAATYRLNLEVLEDRRVLAYAMTFLDISAVDLNDAGQIVGNGGAHAFLLDNQNYIDLGTLGGTSSYANGINDLGQVVGSAYLPGDLVQHAFLITPQVGEWFRDSDLDGRNDLMIDLGILPGSDYSAAADINNAGQVVGNSGGKFFLWDAVNGMINLGAGYATAINEVGQVTGESGLPFLWDAVNGMTILDPGPGYVIFSVGDINDAGQIVGSYWENNQGYGIQHAFVWNPYSPNGVTGRFIDLDGIWGTINSSAADINNFGQIVGSTTVLDYYDNYVTHGILWQGNVAKEVFTPQEAQAINNHGDILARDSYGDSYSYLLTPNPPSPPPTIGIADAPAVTEGNKGTRAATLTVTLSAASTEPITVAYATSDGTATAGSDYQAASGTLTIPAGQTTGTITVLVNGDATPEPDETFFVNLTSADGATIADGQGVATVVNDDVALPSLTVNDVTQNEGRNGTTTFKFIVTLSAPSNVPVTVQYATTDSTATVAGGDYLATSGTLTFQPGQTSKTVSVSVKGDKTKETDETFFLNLANSQGATIADAQGNGTIKNDDGSTLAAVINELALSQARRKRR